jgi:menaquinone-specific isochorismate synthase
VSTSVPLSVRRLVVETREIESADEVIARTDPSHPLVWMRRGEGFAGLGEVARIEVGAVDGPRGTRIRSIADAWRDLTRAARISDDIRIPGTGLVAFGVIAFADDSSAPSTLVVPRVVVGTRHGRSWITTIRDEDDPAPALEPTGFGPYWPATLGPGMLGHEGYREAVGAAVSRVRTGALDKVVLARDLVGSVPADADLRRLVRVLAADYPDCWIYAVDGMIGASPETLVTVSHGTVTARVLAGTAARGADADADTAAAVRLATSPKDREEHRFAVHSVLDALRPYVSELSANTQPKTLKLPNVWHLATDVEGTLSREASSLDLVAAVHPTAAVAGTPTDAALAVIRELEPFDRGRYAGPVGWVDANGDGEWAIALRGAQFGPADTDAGGNGIRPVTAHAGAGIVAGSDPDAELHETRMKFRPIVDALT